MKDTDKLSNQSITRKQTFKRMVNIVNVWAGIVNIQIGINKNTTIRKYNAHSQSEWISSFNFLFGCTHCKTALFCPYHISWTSSFPLDTQGSVISKYQQGIRQHSQPRVSGKLYKYKDLVLRELEECLCVVVKLPTPTHTHFLSISYKSLHTDTLIYMCILMLGSEAWWKIIECSKWLNEMHLNWWYD